MATIPSGAIIVAATHTGWLCTCGARTSITNGICTGCGAWRKH